MKKKIIILIISILTLCTVLAACSTAPSVDILQTILRNKGIALQVQEYDLPEKKGMEVDGEEVQFKGRMTATITAFDENGKVAAEFYYFSNAVDAEKVFGLLSKKGERNIAECEAILESQPDDEIAQTNLAYWKAQKIRINVDVVAFGREDLVKIVKE